MSPVNPKRVRTLAPGASRQGPVIYWMSREQRARDNWGLLHAFELAQGAGQPVVAAFCLAPGFLGATMRHYHFMFAGLKETSDDLAALGIPFTLLMGEPGVEIARLAQEIGAGAVVCDFDPLRVKKQWQHHAGQALEIPLIQVDGHNVVPAWVASDKQEYAARTIRPKLHKRMSEFLEDFPATPKQETAITLPAPDWDKALAFVSPDPAVPPVKGFTPGPKAAGSALDAWVHGGMRGYDAGRNDPNADKQSNLSPYFHFGQLAPQRAAWEAARSKAPNEDAEAFLEELVVRRELSDNFCHYNPHYDSLRGIADWANKTLDEHRGDTRKHVYSHERFEAAKTHSDLWNACQMEMVKSGKMHGYMRMYWAKKILEWSESPEEALDIAIRLNDRFELDGRDPNGYVGCMWSIGGVHDRAWTERPVLGKIRYMNERGCRRKFDVDAYIAKWLGREQASLF